MYKKVDRSVHAKPCTLCARPREARCFISPFHDCVDRHTLGVCFVRYVAYSYGGGRGDGSSGTSGGNTTSSRARESIRIFASSFVDLYAAGYSESSARIRADGVDILVDLQGHTLGGRGEIAAARPARVQVRCL